MRSRFNLSISEALAIYMHSNAAMAAEVILRSCGALTGTDFERCEREVDSDAAEVVNEIRRRTQDSVHGMRTVLQSLAGFEGPKSVIVISEGLVFEGLGGETDDLAGDRGGFARLDRCPAARRATIRCRRKSPCRRHRARTAICK